MAKVTVLDRSSEAGSQPIKLLDAKHPQYAVKCEAWLDLTLLYEGGNALKNQASRVLKKRPREDEEVYSARLERFTYQNILATGLGWYGAALFSEEPEIFFNGKLGSEAYQKFLKNCDGTGTCYVDFFKKIFQTMLTHGVAWVLTDLRAIPEDEPPPITLEEERRRGFLDPHVVAYSPLNVINWETDDLGALKWAVVRTECQEQKFLGKPETVTRWYYYDREEYQVYEYRREVGQVQAVSIDEARIAKLIKSGQHALASVSRVPLRKLLLSEGLWLANRAYIQLVDHLNQDNTLAWSLFMSNLAIPVVIGDFDASAMTYSENGYLQFPAGTVYGWSEPEGKSFDQSAKRVESLREECFRSMNLQAQGRSMHATPAMQSGRSKQLEMAPAKQILTGMGDDLRRHMQDVLVDVRDARKDPGVEPDVRGFVFQEDMTTEEVFAVSSVLSLRIPSEKFEKSIYKKVAKSWLPDANREELSEIFQEIESGPTMEEREQEEFDRRLKLTKIGMERALNKSAGSSSSGGTLPPGRGGSGPSVKSKE